MNYDEIEKCVVRAKNGDKKSVSSIINQYKPFIYKKCKDYNINGNELEDLLQTGYISVLTAITKYLPGSHTFSSYAYTSIINSFKYLARGNKKYNNTCSLNEKISVSSCTEFIDTLKSTDDTELSFISNSDTALIKSILSTLTKEQLELIYLIYYKNISIKTYSELKNISYITAIRKKDKVISVIKNSYFKLEFIKKRQQPNRLLN